MSWLQCELPKAKAEFFEGYLSDNGVCFQSSACFNLVHFDCLMDAAMATKANCFIDLL